MNDDPKRVIIFFETEIRLMEEKYNRMEAVRMIGRKAEAARLNELYESRYPEFVALYGRRRVGKTYLINEVFGDRITFQHAGLSPIDQRYDETGKKASRMKDQLKHFAQSLIQHGMALKKSPESWLDAFYILESFLMEKQASGQKLLVFIDEIQWMDTPKAGFIQALEAFWNGWACRQKNMMVIVCGSSTSWILDKLIHNHGGLYDRVTCQISLQPFTLKECEEFFEDSGIEMSRYDIAQTYMMLGGIPYYLRYFRRQRSMAQNVDAVFFEEDAPLKDEFDKLFASLFTNPSVMKSIVVAVSQKNIGLTRQEILEKTGIQNSGDFSRQLKALIAGRFLLKYSFFGGSKREEYYKLIDPFCIFYLRFVQPNLNRKAIWTNLSESASVTAWRGYAFENICWNHVSQIKSALGIAGVTTTESMWFRRGDDQTDGGQIDFIIERKDHIVHLCEMKFYSEPFRVNKEYHFTLVRRKNMLKELIRKREIVHNTLISTYGLVRNEYSDDFVHSITLDDLF